MDPNPMRPTRIWTSLKHAFRPNFYRLHLTYFFLVIIVGSVILYGSNTADYLLKYVDALFLCTSAMCNVGLNTVNLGQLNGFQQSVLFVLMLMGDLSLVSISVVFVRRHFFGKKIQELVEHSKAGQRVAEDVERDAKAKEGHSALHRHKPKFPGADQSGGNGRTRSRAQRIQMMPPEVGTTSRNRTRQGRTTQAVSGNQPSDRHFYLSFQPNLDSKGRFHNLTQEQYQELGGVEYRALNFLSWFLPAYALFWLFFGMVILAPYATHTNVGNVIRQSQPGDLDPAWWSIFISVSAYTNCGLSVVDENMIPFGNNYLILIITGTLILVGNTLYPVFLRLAIWSFSKVIPRSSELHHSIAFLLHHPRRCYLFLFPRNNTLILLATQVGLNLLAWVLWIILQINYGPIVNHFAPGQRVMDGLYQSHGLRSAGFYIIVIDQLAPALQFFYMVIMYLSVFPIILSVRSTNIYEERSLGQDSDESARQDLHSKSGQGGKQSESGVGSHIRQQLAYDIWWILVAMWLVLIIERDSLTTPAPSWTVFSVIFETVSAYGTVGLSLGASYDDYSFCGTWHSLSKVILMTVMLRGRRRVLPMAVDRAVMLPGEDLMDKLDREYNQKGFDRDERATEDQIREAEKGEQAEKELDRQRDDRQEEASE